MGGIDVGVDWVSCALIVWWHWCACCLDVVRSVVPLMWMVKVHVVFLEVVALCFMVAGSFIKVSFQGMCLP